MNIFALFAPAIAVVLNALLKFIGNYAVVIIIFTFFLKLIMLPTSIKQQRTTARSTRMQPKIQKIQKKYATNKVKMNEEIQLLYQRENYNPMSMGCLPMLLQMVIFMSLYYTISMPLTYLMKIPPETIQAATDALQSMSVNVANAKNAQFTAQMMIMNNYDALASSVPDLANYNIPNLIECFNLFGLDLTQTPSLAEPTIILIIPFASGAASFLLSFITMRQQKKNNPGMPTNAAMNGCMMFFMPLFSLWIAFSVPAGVSFYWFASTAISILQQIIINKYYYPQKVMAEMMIDDTIKRRAKEEYRKKL